MKLNASSESSSPTLSLRSNGNLSISDPTLQSSRKNVNLIYGSDFDEGAEFRFLKLDNDGNVTIYSASKENTSVLWSGVQDQCEVFGYCGTMVICSYDINGSPTCSCPSKNFVLVDPNDSRY